MSKLLLANLAAAAAALSAGVSVIATRYAVGETDPISLAFYRYVIGVICFAPVLLVIWPRSRIPVMEYARIAALGVLFFCLFPWAFNASLQYIPAARGAVGLATIPIQTLIVAAIFGREALTRAKVISVGLAFTGIAIVFGPEAMNVSGSDYLIGDVLMLLGALCAALYSVFSRATLSRQGPLFVTALAMVFGVVALVPLVLLGTGGFKIPEFTSESWFAVLFLGTIGGALQFSLFTWALRWLSPARTVIYLTLNPISAMLLAALLLDETLTVIMALGLVLVLAGIFVSNFSRAKGAPSTKRTSSERRMH